VWDKSDNILGVKGIGENSGGFAQYHNTLDDIYASLAQIKGATAKAEAGKDAAYHSRHMAH